MNLLSLSPLMRSTVGFDRFNDLFQSLETAAGGERFEAYPPYNIEKTGDDRYQIVMAVAGFTMNDLSITAKGDSLTVAGKQEDKAGEGRTFLHRGIATRSFQRTFRLADHIKVVGAEMENGLLTVHLVRDVPEEAKPRMIEVKGAQPAIEGKKAN